MLNGGTTKENSNYRIHYADPNTGFNCGWHQDGDHPDLGAIHFQYEQPETGEGSHSGTQFSKTVPSEILWTALERLFENEYLRLPHDGSGTRQISERRF